jgi:pimeloyl-ACP methyl ester carboxylesterase
LTADDWVETRDRSIFVSRHGDGPPVLLINGIGAHHAMWPAVVDALNGFTTIAFDPPGIGRSPWRAGPLTMPQYAAIASEVLDALGYSTGDVLGYSFGGAVAQQLAFQDPDRVRRLVLVGTSCGWGGVPGRAGAVAMIGSPLRYYSRLYYNATAHLVAGGTAERTGNLLSRVGELRQRHPPTWQGYQSQLYALTLWSSLRWLRALRPPTLVVSGDDDPIIPLANGAQLAHHIPRARLRVQNDEGHFLLLNSRASALPAIAEFLRSDDAESSDAWQSAADVSAAEMAREIHMTRRSAQPLGLMNAFARAFAV